MSSDLVFGKDYGLIVKRSVLSHVLLNIPLLNLLYSKRVEVNATSILNNRPCCGVFKHTRVFFFQKKLDIRFRFPRDSQKSRDIIFSAAYISIKNFYGHEIAYKEIVNTETPINTWTWTEASIKL